VGNRTDAYEVDPRDYEELRYGMDNRVYNGSTKLITALMALMNILVAAAVVGGVVLYGKVEALDSKVDLILTGRLRILGDPYNPYNIAPNQEPRR
jgi:hypothetical protein